MYSLEIRFHSLGARLGECAPKLSAPSMKRNSIDSSELSEHELVAGLLSWYAASGVDHIVFDAPVNRYDANVPGPNIEAPPPHRQQARDHEPPSPSRQRRPAGKPAGIPVDTRALAGACQSVGELREAIESFSGLDITRTATNTVFADGNADADLMLVGEAPGAEEDRQGLPFVGAAGQLLDKMLASIGRDRSSAYISNILNWRPPGNRTPTPEEAATCLPFIRRHIELVDPEVVVLLGGTAAKHLIGTTTGITRLRGKWTEILISEQSGKTKPALPLFHPAYLLRQAPHKKLAWADLLLLEEKLEGAERR